MSTDELYRIARSEAWRCVRWNYKQRRHLLEDLVQDAVVMALDGLAKYPEAGGAAVRRWCGWGAMDGALRAAGINPDSKAYRRGARDYPRMAPIEQAAHVPAAVDDEAELREAADFVLTLGPPRAREAMRLYLVVGNVRDVGEALGVSRQTVCNDFRLVAAEFRRAA